MLGLDKLQENFDDKIDEYSDDGFKMEYKTKIIVHKNDPKALFDSLRDRKNETKRLIQKKHINPPKE